MSSVSENNVTAAATEIQESLAQNPMQLADATPVYQPQDVLLTNPVNPNDVYAQPDAVLLAQGASEAELSAPEVVDAGVVNVSVVANDQNNGNSISNEAVNEVLPTSQPNPPLMNYQNNGNDNNAVLDGSNEMVVTPTVGGDQNKNGSNEVVTPGVVGDQNNNGSKEEVVVTSSIVGNQNNDGSYEVVTPSVVGDQNNYGSNEEVVVTPCVVGNQNNNGSYEVVIPSVVADQNNYSSNEEVVVGNQNNNGSYEVFIPSVVGDQNNYGSNEVVTPSVVGDQNNYGSNEVVTPSVVNYQDNGIGNNPVASNSGVGETIKRKRGRPRKYPIGDASSVPAVSSPSMAMQSGGQVPRNAQVQGSFVKRGRGRPAGSGKKHKADGPSPFAGSPANSGSTGGVFLPYVITVKSGEYVQPALLSLSQYDKQVICVLSATGTISNVTLQQPKSGGNVTYQGCFEILSLSGSFLQSESGGGRSISGGLSVSLAVPNGVIFGGGVSGPLIADSDVQIIVGTFLTSEQNLTRSVCNNVLTPLNHISSVGGSPPSRALLSESSGASRNPFNQSNGGCNNGNQQPVPNVTWM